VRSLTSPYHLSPFHAIDSVYHEDREDFRMHIKLATCQVRSWRLDDAAVMAGYANNRKIWRNLRDAFPHPYTLDDAKRFIDLALEDDSRTFLCITRDDQPIGSIGFTAKQDVERFSAEIGYWLAEPFWGQGITTEALRAVTGHAMVEHGLHRLYATPFAWNKASARVLEKAGYVLEGRLRCSAFKEGQLVDQLMYAFTSRDCHGQGTESPA
jgi:ribosomal-protein-alanine N-acetyltransferase